MFTQTLFGIINCLEKVPDFDDHQVHGVNPEKLSGEIVAHRFDKLGLQRFIRLQALARAEYQKGETNASDQVFSLADDEKERLDMRVNLMKIRQDSLKRVRMIQQLIVELVHEAAPKETEHFNVRYYIDWNRQIHRVNEAS